MELFQKENLVQTIEHKVREEPKSYITTNI